MRDPKQLYHPPGTPPGPYVRGPVEDQQVAESHRLILAAAAEVEPGRVAVLGAGNCAEIPLAELAARFAHVTINDVDAAELEKGIAAAKLDATARGKLDIRVADLTGTTDPLLEKLAKVIAETSDADEAIERMAAMVDDTTVTGMSLDGKFDLLVASCVMSQLHFGLLHRAADLFEAKFKDAAETLRQSVRWSAALYDMARRMEARLIDDLAAHLVPGGLIYLSDSTQMCYVTLREDGQWETPGTFRMLRSQYITDYLDGRFVVVASGRWHWLVSPPRQPGDEGRLFDVQAVILRCWRI